jgi:hydrogenase/urease accessory protein HupE
VIRPRVAGNGALATNGHIVQSRSVRFPRALLAALLLVLGLCSARTSTAHAPESSVYSKYEATTSGDTIAFVFAFPTRAIVPLVSTLADKTIDRSDLASYEAPFSRYLFDRFSVSNDGEPCEHPPQLTTFFWDAPSNRALAVTKFVCRSKLAHLTIRSRVTHDMPVAHELVGDLRHGPALVRSFFSGDDAEASIDLSSLTQSPAPSDPDARRSARPGVPEQERRYEDLASKALGIDLAGDAGTDVHPMATLAHFVREGVLHIFSGYDHIAFVVTLVLGLATWKRLALIVTAFTAAHSLTLALATFGLVTLSPRLVEPLIALTVFLVAADSLARPKAAPLASVAFGFGLIHGLGLSNVLRDLGLTGRELAPALLGFNLGVELGQLAIVAPIFVLVVRLRRREATFARVRGAVCLLVALAAVVWIVLRVRTALVA